MNIRFVATFYFLSLFFSALLCNCLAQNDSLPKKEKTPFKKNNLKINLSSLTLNNYSFYYERSLSRKISFQAGYRFMPNTILGNIKMVEKIIDRVGDENGEIKDDLDKIAASNSAITGEFRFYGGRKPGARGFYLSLYGRYMNLKFDYPYDYEASGKAYIIPLMGNTNGFGGGLMIGAQWLIAKRVVFDVYFLGCHYGKITGNINGFTDLSSMSSQDKQGLQNELENLFGDEAEKYLQVTVNNQGVKVIVDGPFVGIRGLGLSVGIAF